MIDRASPMVRVALGAGIVLLLVAPAVVYPVFLMKVLCYAMLAASLNLLLGYVGLLSFGHAMRGASTLPARRASSWPSWPRAAAGALCTTCPPRPW